jgi:hypothetical protein
VPKGPLGKLKKSCPRPKLKKGRFTYDKPLTGFTAREFYPTLGYFNYVPGKLTAREVFSGKNQRFSRDENIFTM